VALWTGCTRRTTIKVNTTANAATSVNVVVCTTIWTRVIWIATLRAELRGAWILLSTVRAVDHLDTLLWGAVHRHCTLLRRTHLSIECWLIVRRIHHSLRNWRSSTATAHIHAIHHIYRHKATKKAARTAT
jgi:hypothetical protein